MEGLDLLLQKDVLFWIVGGGIAVTWILAATIASMAKTLSREKTRREIAAYIAEGAMTPEQGEKLMKAGEDAEA